MLTAPSRGAPPAALLLRLRPSAPSLRPRNNHNISSSRAHLRSLLRIPRVFYRASVTAQDRKFGRRAIALTGEMLPPSLITSPHSPHRDTAAQMRMSNFHPHSSIGFCRFCYGSLTVAAIPRAGVQAAGSLWSIYLWCRNGDFATCVIDD